MGVQVSLDEGTISATPGIDTTVTVTVLNSGAIVDEISLQPLGAAAAHLTLVPATLSLMPGTVGTSSLTISIPTGSPLRAGDLSFGILARSGQQQDESDVAEGSIALAGLAALQAEVIPTTSYGRSKGKHTVVLTNDGNAPVTAMLDAYDPDAVLDLTLTASQVTIGPGEQKSVGLRLSVIADTDSPRMPFVVKVVQPGEPPREVPAAFARKRRNIVPFVMAGIAAAVIAALFFINRGSGDKGGLNVAGTTTTQAGATTIAGAGDPGATVPGGGPATTAPGGGGGPATTAKGAATTAAPATAVPASVATTRGNAAIPTQPPPIAPSNLLANPTAEGGGAVTTCNESTQPVAVPSWTASGGATVSTTNGGANSGCPTAGSPGFAGTKAFWGGPGIGTDLKQSVTASGRAGKKVTLSAALGGFCGSPDLPQSGMLIEFLTAQGGSTGTGANAATPQCQGSTYKLQSASTSAVVPADAATIRVTLYFHGDGGYSGAFADNVSLLVS